MILLLHKKIFLLEPVCMRWVTSPNELYEAMEDISIGHEPLKESFPCLLPPPRLVDWALKPSRKDGKGVPFNP